MAARQYVQKEWRLLSWWLALNHPNADISLNIRLGAPVARIPLPGEASSNEPVSRVFQRYADCLFIENGYPTIVEAKLEPDPGIFSQLIHYARKFRMDPAWSHFANVELKLVALVYHDDPTVSIEAPYYRVNWEVYRPNLAVLPAPAQRILDAVQGEVPPPLPSDWPARLSSWGIKALAGG
jgi:hypothetical protein